MDNAAIHHYQAGEALGEWMDDIGCLFVYLPTYSAEMSAAENVLYKLKTILSGFEFWELLHDNLHVAISEARKEITPDDIRIFFFGSLDISVFECCIIIVYSFAIILTSDKEAPTM